MNVSIETMSGLERRLTIAIDSSQFEEQITHRLEDARSKVKLPGFRAGKVPLKEVRRRFGASVRAEVAGELMQSTFSEAITQENLNPAGSPKLDVVKMDPGKDFEFTATFEVFPAVDLVPFDKVSIKRPMADVAEDDIDDMVQRLREQQATQEPAERPAAEGDVVKVDFTGTLDGERVDSACGEGMSFTVGEGQMIEDFDHGVIGLGAGEEKTFDAVFPEDYRAEELQGKTVQFSVKMLEVAEKTLPELGPELYEKFAADIEDEAGFRSNIAENMQRELNGAIKQQVKQQVMDSLSGLHSFSLPYDVVQREIKTLKEQMMQQFQLPPGQSQGIDLPDSLFQEQAEKRVRVGLIINEIIQKGDLTADPEMVDEQLQVIAAPYDEPTQVIEWYRSNPEQMANIEMAVLEDQVVDHILDSAQIEEVHSVYQDVISGNAIAPEPQATDEGEDASDAIATEDVVVAEESQDK